MSKRVTNDVPLPTRRSFLAAFASALVFAPAVVRIGSIMPISDVGLVASSCPWTPIIHAGQVMSLPHPGPGLWAWHMMCGTIRPSEEPSSQVSWLNGSVMSRENAKRIIRHQNYVFRNYTPPPLTEEQARGGVIHHRSAKI